MLRDILLKYIELVPKDELETRVHLLKDSMEEDAAFLIHPPDIYYFAGTKQEGLLVVPKEGEPVFMVIKHFERASVECPFTVVNLGSLRKLPEAIAECGFSFSKVAIELDVISFALYSRLRKALPQVELTDISPRIREIKAVKSSWEINILRKAANIVDAGYKKAVEVLKDGITEIEISAHALFEMRRLGHESGEVMRAGRMEGFLGHVLSGEAAAVPSYMNAPLNGVGISPAMPGGPSRKKVTRGEPVIFDFFGTYMGYLVDMTRTFGLSPIPDKFKKAYDVVLEIHAYLRDNLKHGASSLEIFNKVLEIASKSDFGDYFMGYGKDKVAFVGHGVGTEINEYPFIAKGLDMELKKGMVVAVEPKFIFPGEGAVGMENTYLIKENGAESLTLSSEELIEKG